MPRRFNKGSFATLLLLALIASPVIAAPIKEVRGGPRDFDFEFGVWRAHLRRLVNPLSGSTKWVELNGTSVVRKVWGGRANLGELDIANTDSHIEGLSLRTYNPETRQWNLSWVNARDGTVTPPMVGGFNGGRGEFYNRDMFRGKPIVVRFIFSDVTANTFKLEQAFSGDDGKTWEANWIATFERENPAAKQDPVGQ